MSREKQRTRTLSDGPVEGVVTIDDAGAILAADPGVERIFGYSRAELVGRDVSMLLPEVDRSGRDESPSRGRRTGEARFDGIGREVAGLRRDGTRFPMDLTIGEFRVGGHRCFTVVVRDVDGHWRAEEADARLAAIVESSDDAIFGTDLDGLITSWNAGAERILGYRAEEILGRPGGVLLPTDRQHEGPEILERIERGERVEPYESVRVAKDGRRVDLSISVSPIRDGTGRLVGTSRIGRDITDRRRATQALKQLARLLDQAFDPILVWEPDGGIRSWNRGASQLYGFTAAEAVGRVGHELLHTEFPDGRDDCESALRRTGRWEGELRQRTRDGRRLTVESRMSLVRMDDRREHVLEVNRDITARKLAEEAIRHRLELQQQLSMIAASVPGVIFSFRMRPDGTASIPFAMPAIEDLYGIPTSVLADDVSPVYANVHPDDAGPLIEGIDEAFRRTAPWHSRYRYRHPAKGERWIEGWSRAQAEPDRSVLWHGFLMDVTEREQSEAARRESDRMARSVLDALSSQIAVLDESGTIRAVNRAWRSFGEEKDAAVGVDEGANYLAVCDSVEGPSRPIAAAFAAGIREVLAGSRPLFELEYACHFGSRDRWFIGRVVPFHEGGPRRAVVSHEEITERKVAEERTLETARMLAQSQRLAHVGSWELDVQDPSDFLGGALRWSDECYRIFGYEPGRVAVDIDLFFGAAHPDDRESIATALARTIRERHPFSIEHRITRPDGTERVVEGWGEVIADADGRPVRMVGTCQDVTERRRAEAALARYTHRLECLRAVDLAILSSRSPREIAEAALTNLARLVDYWTGSVSAYDFDREEVELIADAGILREWYPPGSRLRHRLGGRPEIEALRDGRTWCEEDISGTRPTSPVLEALRDAGLRSYVLLPLLGNGPVAGSLFLASDRPAAFSPEQIDVARAVADQLGIALRQARLFEEVEAARVRLADLSRRLIRAQEDERHHIARELHDEIGQALTAIKIHLQVIGRYGLDPVATEARLDESIALIERTLRQIRGISLDLRPLLLDDFGLVAALRSFLEHQSRIAGFAARFEVAPGVADVRPEPELETACFRVAQEAVTNIARHAGARDVVVELRRTDGELELVVRDDGAGFDVAEAQSRGATGASLGLVGMRERVGILGGRMAIRSEPGRGTEVSARFPLIVRDFGG